MNNKSSKLEREREKRSEEMIKENHIKHILKTHFQKKKKVTVPDIVMKNSYIKAYCHEISG